MLPRTLNRFEQRWSEVAEPFAWNFTRGALGELIERLGQHEAALAHAA